MLAHEVGRLARLPVDCSVLARVRRTISQVGLSPEQRRRNVAGAFKVPTLRNVLVTAPYGHHGEIERLADVVRHYSENPGRQHAGGQSALKPLRLSPQEQSDLVVFLESLSTFSNPWRPEDTGRCY